LLDDLAQSLLIDCSIDLDHTEVSSPSLHYPGSSIHPWGLRKA
jgi:hypothetical protein